MADTDLSTITTPNADSSSPSYWRVLECFLMHCAEVEGSSVTLFHISGRPALTYAGRHDGDPSTPSQANQLLPYPIYPDEILLQIRSMLRDMARRYFIRLVTATCFI